MAPTSNYALAPGEQECIDVALKALEADSHAPREITVRMILNVYREFPKHVTVGQDKDGNPIIKVAENAEEEADIVASTSPPAKKEPVKADEEAEEAIQ